MKRIEDYTAAELIGLSEGEIDNLVDLECAYCGIPLPTPHPGEKPVKPELKTTTYYEYLGIIFVDKKSLNRVKDVVESAPIYETQYYSGEYYVREAQDYRGNKTFPEATVRELPTKEEIDKTKSAMESYNLRYSQYSTALKAYNESKEARAEFYTAIQDKIAEYQEFQRDTEIAMEKYLKYYELAEENISIADNFYWQTHHDDVEAHIEGHIRAIKSLELPTTEEEK